MSNAKKILDKRAEKPPREARVKKVKVDLNKLPDAIVDGRLVVPVGGNVVFQRTLNQRTAIHEGHVFSVDVDGSVMVWDQTRGQFFGFNINQQLPVMKAASEADVVSSQEGLNVVAVDKECGVGRPLHEGTDPDKSTLVVEGAAAGVSEPDGR